MLWKHGMGNFCCKNERINLANSTADCVKVYVLSSLEHFDAQNVH